MGLYKCSLNENQPKGDKTKETLYLYIDDIMIDVTKEKSNNDPSLPNTF